MKLVISFCLALLFVTASVAWGSVDELENIGPDNTPVINRIIDGVLVKITPSGGLQMLARTYNDTTATEFAFLGHNGDQNAPLNPDSVSGTRFIGSWVDGENFPEAEPILFEFDKPVTTFGLTTLDLLETGEDAESYVKLVGYNSMGAPVDSMVRFGPQDGSGLDLDWIVSGTGIVKAVLSGSVSQTYPGYGIDDLMLTPQQQGAALDRIGLTVLGLVLAASATLSIRYRRRPSRS